MNYSSLLWAYSKVVRKFDRKFPKWNIFSTKYFWSMVFLHFYLIFSVHLSGEKAVDCLMESKWTKEPKDRQDSLTPYFKTRTNAIDYCIQWVASDLYFNTCICTQCNNEFVHVKSTMLTYSCACSCICCQYSYCTCKDSDRPFHAECIWCAPKLVWCVCLYLCVFCALNVIHFAIDDTVHASQQYSALYCECVCTERYYVCSKAVM